MLRIKIFLTLAVLNLSLVLVLAVGAQTAARPTPKPLAPTTTVIAIPAPKVDLALERRQKAFDTAWRTIRDFYFDGTFGGLDWDKVRDEYQPRVAVASSDAAVHEIILEMVNRLDKSHFGLIPPEYFAELKQARIEALERERLLAGDKNANAAADKADADEDMDLEAAPLGRYGVGIEVRVIDARFVITTVQPGSSSAAAGIKPGFVLDKINGVSMTDLVKRIEKNAPNVRHLDHYLPSAITAWILDSYRESPVLLTCLDGADVSHDFKVMRKALPGESVSLGSQLPEQFLEFESRSLSDDVGYIKFNLFAWQVLGKFCDALTAFHGKKAIIVDLRGNVGGLLLAMEGISGMLVDHEMDLGTAIVRAGPQPLIVTPKVKHFSGRLVFLVDDQTMSASELITGGMQDNSRALIIGQRTAGEALPAVSVKLATGAVLEYPIANFKTPSGKTIEGSGVDPDVTAALDRQSLIAGRDLQLDRALEVIRDGTAFDRLAAQLPLVGHTVLPPPSVSGIISTAVDDPPPPPVPKPTPRPAPAVAATDDLVQTLPSSPPIQKPTPKPPPKAVSSEDTGATLPPPGKPATTGTPPIKEMRLSRSGTVDVPPPAASVKDARSMQILADFSKAIGGMAGLKKVSSFDADGVMQMTFGTNDVAIKYRVVRASPTKMAVIMNSDVFGEVTQVQDGKTSFVESNIGLNGFKPSDLGANESLFMSIGIFGDPAEYSSLKYLGVFDVGDGVHKMALIRGTTTDGRTVGLQFDPVSKVLTHVTSSTAKINFGDYQKTGNLTLPFSVGIDGGYNMQFNSIKIDQPIDQSIFVRKENCFDKP